MSRHRALVGLALLLTGSAVLLWWGAGAPAARVVVPALVWVAIAGLVAVVALRYRARRRAHLARVGARAAQAERGRLAADMHDVLGHELALLATQAARLEMTPDVDPAGQAATIRRRARDAVERLHDVLRLLGAADRTEPPDLSLRGVLDGAAEAGLDLRTQLDDVVDDPAELDPVVSAALTGLVREAVTNAARHAPGSTVDVTVRRVDDTVRVVVENDSAVSRPAARRSGLATWDRRLRVIGGTLDVRSEAGRHRLEASMPLRADLRGHLDRVPVERPPWVIGLAVPLGALLVVVIGTWAISSHDRTLSAENYARIQVGRPIAEIGALLPPREALLVLAPVAPPPDAPDATCRLYTDGNLPVAQASFQVCLGDGRVLAVRDLR